MMLNIQKEGNRMANNKDLILKQYGDGSKEENRHKRSRASSLEFYYTKKHLEPFISKETRILEIGCGTGYYGMYYADKCKEYCGVDIVPSHIEIFRKKIEESGYCNLTCSVGDATDLTEIESNSYDVVLCLGPLYHLSPKEAEAVVAECFRISKPKGIVAISYINKIGLYAGACISTEFMDYPNESGNKMLEDGCDFEKPGLYWYTTPEDMERITRKYGLEKIHNLGTDFYIFMKYIDKASDEKFELIKPLYDQMAFHESCTGISNHALLICRKRDD